jgi:hypothetical protein
MPNYQTGKIYKLIDNTNNDIYIGSTTQSLARRLRKHKSDSKNYGKIQTKRVIKYSSHSIIMNGDYSISLLEDFACNTKDELRQKEQEWIDKTECINSQRAYRSPEYIEKYNRDWFKKRAINDKAKIKQYKHDLFQYQSSWGGSRNSENNLLKIDYDLFLT